ncbi:sporulation integral membrane protein YtvI [Lutibacter sp. B2]|nr:sporulation integral membrane protein YtvI [Lutibacter sp. B2]
MYIPFLTRVLIIIITIFCVYTFSTTLLSYILPFILAWIIAYLLQPFINFLHRRLNISRNISTIIVVLTFVLLTTLLTALIGGVIILQLNKLYLMLPQYSKKIYDYNTRIMQKLQYVYINLPPNLSQSISNSFYIILENSTALIGKSISSLLGFISAIPNFIAFLFVTMISTFFIARDRIQIKRFFISQMNENFRTKSIILKNNLSFTLLGYVKAQLILMGITFIESAIGLTLIGIDYSILLAFLASTIDALPIVGTGMIYFPLIAYYIAISEYNTSLYLSILYLLILLVRQLLEPKILGNQIGIYPLVTLISMYIGLKAFGIIGIITGPVSVTLLISLQKINLLPKWKK